MIYLQGKDSQSENLRMELFLSASYPWLGHERNHLYLPAAYPWLGHETNQLFLSASYPWLGHVTKVDGTAVALA